MTYFRQEKEEEEKESEEKGSDEDDDESGEKKDVTSGPWGKVEAPAPAPAPHKLPEPEPGQWTTVLSWVQATDSPGLPWPRETELDVQFSRQEKQGKFAKNITNMFLNREFTPVQGKFRVFKFKDVRGLWWDTVFGFEANFELGNN